MAWSDPVTRSTGDLITASIWNQEVVENPQILHDRNTARIVTGIFATNQQQQNSMYKQRLQAATDPQTYYIYVPSDFESVTTLEFIYSPATTGTSDIDVLIHYGKLGDNEDEDNHTGSITGGGEAVTQDKLYSLDLSGQVASLAAGDVLSIQVLEGGGAVNLYEHGILWDYQRT